MKILFICKSNVGRSQMAESFFKVIDPNSDVFSAGILVKPENEGKPISNITYKVIDCMNEVSIDVKNNRMNQLTEDMVNIADKIISITPEYKLPDYLSKSTKLSIWNIPDAGGTDMDFHRKVRDMVNKRVKSLVVE